jgi:hypothetical protein
MTTSSNHSDNSNSKQSQPPGTMSLHSSANSINSNDAIPPVPRRPRGYSHEEYKHCAYESWLTSSVEENKFGFRSGAASRAASPPPGSSGFGSKKDERWVGRTLELVTSSIDEKLTSSKTGKEVEK